MNRQNQERYDKFISDFKTVVDMDSSSGYYKGIEQVACFFKQRFQALSMEASIEYAGKNKVPCLVARNRPEGQTFDLMCLGHMDTVFPKGEAVKRPFSMDEEKAYGPGVSDMKGGLLVVLHALETLHERGQLNTLSICVVFNGDEETGSKDSRDWIKDLASKSLRVLVFEPCRPGFNMVKERKGGGWFTISVKGCAAHAGADPEKGINAVVELARQIIAVNTLNDTEKGTSAQVTVVRGGDKINIIPDTAVASVDVRIARHSEKKRVEDFFDALSKTPETPGAKISVQGIIDRMPMEYNDGAKKLFNEILSQAAALGIEASGIATGGCSDGNFTSAMGIPTIDGMGTVGDNSHREDEYVQLSSIIPMITLLADLCQRFSKA